MNREFSPRPWFDKIAALVAVAPYAYSVWLLTAGGLHIGDLPLLAYIIDCALMILFMLTRTPPSRVTAKPLYWAITFLASYWCLLWGWAIEPGARLAPLWLTTTLTLLSLLLYVWARLTLGRSMGFLPAQRKLIFAGPYHYVRHPIYLALFVDLTSAGLAGFSLRNAIFLILGMTWFACKTLVEEEFLRRDPAYAEYMRQVPSRWFPRLRSKSIIGSRGVF